MPDVIWDLHCHFSGVPGRTPEERIEQLLVYADRLGIERLCLYMGMPWSQNPTPERLRKENDQVLEALARLPDRLFGFAYVSGEHPEASVAEIDRCVRDGPMVGIKLWVAKHCNAPELDPIIDRAAALKAVDLPAHLGQDRRQHVSRRVEPCRPRRAGEAASGRAADLRAHGGHLGARHPHRPRVQADLDRPGGLGPDERVRRDGRPRARGRADHLRQRRGGPELRLAARQGLRAGLDDNSRRLILSGNLRRMMTPILNAKGVRV